MAANQELLEHYETTLCISRIRLCANCPLKLYAKKNENIVLGIGNVVTDTIMILPSYDVKAKIGYRTMLNVIQDVYRELTSRDVLEDYYITRSIKCLNKTDFNLEKDAIKYCISNLFWEIGRIAPSKLIIFDKQLYDFNYNSQISIKTVMSPGVMYYDNQKLKDVFIKQFNAAINDTQLCI